MPTEPPSTAARRLPRLAAVLMAATALAACSGRSDDGAAQAAAAKPGLVTLTSAQLAHIGLYTVAPRDFSPAIEASGVVDFDNDQATSVVAPMSGPVTRLLVTTGEQVRAGQPLALVASPDYASAIGAYRKAAVAAANARRIAETDQDLLQHNGVSAREAAQAQADAAGAEADRDAALQALVAQGLPPQTLKAVQEGRTTAKAEGSIRAPIAGTVVEKLITPGQLLQAGTTAAFTVADLSRVWVMAQIPAGDLGPVKVGDPAEIDTGSGVVDGTVDNISAVVNPDTRAVLARVVAPNPGGVLKKQMYVRVKIRSRTPASGLLVPASAILRDEENLPFVYVSEPAGFARRRVTLGERVGDAYQVTEGLAAGQRIVVDGGLFLQFMQNQ